MEIDMFTMPLMSYLCGARNYYIVEKETYEKQLFTNLSKEDQLKKKEKEKEVY
jgi:hypothetical protein